MRWQAEATKRKHQVSSDAPPAKRRSEISSVLAKKASDKETQRTFKGSTHKTFPPKKYLDSIGNGRQEEKPCIKTSSLFKNNPEIPELHRCVFQCRCASGVSSHGHLVLHCCLGTDAHFVFPLQHCSEAGSRASVLSRSFPGAGPPPTSNFHNKYSLNNVQYDQCSEVEYPSAIGRQRCPCVDPDGLRENSCLFHPCRPVSSSVDIKNTAQ